MLSNTFKKSIIALLIIALFTTSTITAFASNEKTDTAKDTQNTQITTNLDSTELQPQATEKLDTLIQNVSNDPAVGVLELKNSILQKETSTEGLATKHEIKNINVFKSALQLKYPEMDDLELGKSILLSLGDSEEFINTLPEEKIIEATRYISLEKTESFFKQALDGTRIEICAHDYYNSLSQHNEESSSYTDDRSTRDINYGEPTDHIYKEIEQKDSYLKLTSTAYLTNPSYALKGRNYFTLRGEAEWTDQPIFQDEDILAIGSGGVSDNNIIPFAVALWSGILYGDTYDYAYTNVNNGCGEVNFGTKLKITEHQNRGVSVNVDLMLTPGEDLKKVYAYHGIVTQSDINFQVAYAHKTLGVTNPSVSFDILGNINFSASLTTMDEYYGQVLPLFYESYYIKPLSQSGTLTINASDTAPTFEWKSDYSSPDTFILQIDYLNNGTFLTKTTPRENYTLSSSEWELIKDNALFTNTIKTFRWRIKIDFSIYTGISYYSDWNDIKITGVSLTSEDDLIISSSTRYTEKILNLGSGGYKDFNITFNQGKTKLIQTFGNKDTVLELYSSSGTLLKSNDDGGYNNNGFLAYYFTSNTQYKLRVKFYNSSLYGTTKLAITPACGAPKQGLSAITTYDDIRSAEGTSATWLTYAQPYYTRVLVFNPTVSGDYKFEIESEFDTYLYVIDPRSTTSLVYNVNYNDDSGEGNNPLMTTYLTANVPYLVIYSAYNPASLTEDLDLTLRISKQ